MLDNLLLGAESNLAHIQGDLTILKGDICDREMLRKAVQGKNWVFHFAAYPSVPYSIEHPELTTRQQAALALGAVPGLEPAAVDALRQATHSEDPRLMTNAAHLSCDLPDLKTAVLH